MTTTTDTTATTPAAAPFLPAAMTSEAERPNRYGIDYLQWAVHLKPHGAKRLRGNPMRKFVLIALAKHSNDDGECWPSQATLARMTGLDVKEVGRNLTKLENDGLITRRHRINPETGRRTSDFYQLNMPVASSTSVH